MSSGRDFTQRGDLLTEMHSSPQQADKPGATSDVSLAEAPLSTPLKVTGITGGCQSQTRLAALGILPGEQVEIIQRDNGGPLLLDVKGTRVALGRGISSKVLVAW